MNRKLLVLAGAVVLAAPHGAAADGPAPSRVDVLLPSREAQVYKGHGFTVDMSYGILTGKAKEIVYNPAPAATFRWGMHHTVMASGMLGYSPFHWLTFGLKGSMNLNQSGDLSGFDATGLTTSSPDTELQKAYLFDAFAKARLAQLHGVSISALGGYKADYFRWQAFNGTQTNPAATFASGLGSTYEQWWKAPYVGLALDGTHGRLGYYGRAIVGRTSAHDRDQNHFISVLFKDQFEGGRMVGADFGLSYDLMQGVKATLDYQYQNWAVVKGPSTTTALATGVTTTAAGDASGLANSYHLISLGVKIDLQNLDADDRTRFRNEPAAARLRWAGIYAGAAFGSNWERTRWTTTALPPPGLVAGTANADLDSQGLWRHSFLGYGWTKGHFMFGLEGDFGKSSTSAYVNGIPGTDTAAALAASPDSIVAETGWDGSVRGRLGVLVMRPLQVYVTGGVAVQQMTLHASCNRLAGNWCAADRHERATKNLIGWTAGGGLEWALANDWFARAEYRYSDYGKWSHTFFENAPADSVVATVHSTSHRASVGLGHRF